MKAGDVRKAMGAEFCSVADALKETFGVAKLDYLDTPLVKVGRDPSAGSVRTDGKVDEIAQQMGYWYRARQA
jgi:hypothetical protein